jgi:anti-sigma factor RsiW
MRISDRDLELLSTYLDGRLNQTDQARLETRLQKDANLREVYEQLHRTRLVLRSLPKMRAPRNYTLSPRMVPARTFMPQSYPVLRLVTALASFLLIFALLGDFFVFRTADQVSQSAERAVEAPAAVMEAPLMAPQATTVSEEATEMQALEALGALEAERQPTSEILEMAPAAPSEGAANQDQAKQIPSIQGEARASVTDEEPARAQLYSQRAFLRPLEVTLAVIAIIAGILAGYQRRRMRALSPPK